MSSKYFYCFRERCSYYFKSLRWTFFSHYSSKTYKLKNKPPFDFSFGMRDKWLGYETVDILLFCPVPGGTFVLDNGKMREIWNGDFTGEAYFYTTKGLLNMLHKERSVVDE